MRLVLTLQPRLLPFIIRLAFKVLIQPWTSVYFSHPLKNLICKYNLQPESRTTIAADWNGAREIGLYNALFGIIK